MRALGLLIIVSTTLFPAVQLAALPNVTDKVALFSQYIGIAALILMAWSQVMATRLPGVETLLGGLDRVYVIHKWAGITAMAAILLHDTIDADMDGIGRETVLTEIAETLGEMSLYGLLILVVISVATFIPYHLWKWTHKAMGAFFVAGALHFVFILKPFAMTDPAGLYAGVFCLAGLLAYAYTLLPERMRRARRYTVTDISRTGGATAITLQPQNRTVAHRPGQFGLFQFEGINDPEVHPFSFSSAPQADGQLRVTVKALGDHTTGLTRKVAEGQTVRVQGPFGRFERRASAKPEIWIAGGIGITPFLAWAQALSPNDGAVTLYYAARSKAEAPHLTEIRALADTLPNLTLHVMLSSDGHRLTADTIAEGHPGDLRSVKVAYCGPEGLRTAMTKGLRNHGVSARNFHFEAFEFRTGVGLEALARWVLARALDKARSLRTA